MYFKIGKLSIGWSTRFMHLNGMSYRNFGNCRKWKCYPLVITWWREDYD